MTVGALPHGFAVRIAADVRVRGGGRILVGGSPVRVMRLAASVAERVDAGVLRVVDRATGLVAERLLAANLAFPELGPGPGASGLRTPDDRLTVVVPIRDRADKLDRLLGRLDGALPVVVVDDASRDPWSVRAVAARHGAKLVALTDNVGPAGARNVGLAMVETELVAFVDSDVVVDVVSLWGLSQHFVDNRVAAVAPRVRGATPRSGAHRFEHWDADGASLDLGRRPSLVRPWSRVGWLPSACLVVRTDDLAAGAFEPGLRVGEDVDLVWRLVRDGRHVRYDPAYLALHDSRDTWCGWGARKAYYGTGGAWLARRHGDWMAPAVLSPVPAAALVAVTAQRWWSLPFAIAACALVERRLRAVLPEAPDRAGLAAELTVDVATSTLRQGAQLVLRHWWPATAAACLVSGRARRTVAAAMLFDALDDLVGDDATASSLSPFERFVVRRLDDLTYGAGLWWGALLARSPRVIMPKITHRARVPDDLRAAQGQSARPIQTVR